MRTYGRPRNGGRVLVCDDNLLIADVVVEFLRECGLEPMGPLGRLESAMHMARERALDGAILDLNLNGRPCFPICAILSARRIPFMFLTGYPHACFRSNTGPLPWSPSRSSPMS
jgi:DNA-binding response OmpR family regulator